VGALLLGLYFLWDENQSLKTTLIQVTKQLNNIEERNQKLQQIILQNKQNLEKKSTQKFEFENKKIKEKNAQEKVNEVKSKQIVIILPENEKNYSKVIPNIEYKHIPLEKDSNKDDKVKISPEVFIDKDEKKINGGKINIETKF
jgi:hypothetical protein